MKNKKRKNKIRILNLIIFASLLFIISSSFVIAQISDEVNPYRANDVVVDLSIKSTLLVTAEQSDYILDFLNADLFFKPLASSTSTILELSTVSDSTDKKNYLNFRWDKVLTGVYGYGFESKIKNENKLIQIKEKIKFPAQISGMSEFLKASKHIDSTNPLIIKQANKLARGEDDYYELVSKMGIWVKNYVTYDLSTMTAEVSQKASWVLENKIGVCDELTSLFIAMLRAVGIPAKFVSGIAYTEDPQFPDNWGAHGWAEVYFPNFGWVPFDPTYGEFGWVDPTHIKLKESKDPAEASVKYEWQGRNVQVSSDELDIQAKFIKIGNRAKPLIQIDVKPLHASIGIGSHNLIQADITNLNDYYLTVELLIAKVAEMELLDSTHKQVVLRPNETRKVFWKAKLSSTLDPNYIYTIPLLVESVRKEKGESKFKIIKNGPIHNEKSVQDAQKTLEEERTKEESQDLKLECATQKKEYYEYETNTVNCVITNLGNFEQKKINVCLISDCKLIDLGISQSRSLEFELKLKQAGTQTILISANNDKISKTSGVLVTLLDDAKLEIEISDLPASVEYNQEFIVKFLLKKMSLSKIQNINAKVQINKKISVISIDELDGEQTIESKFNSKNLNYGQNKILILADYTDKTGKAHHIEQEYEIELVNLTLLQKIWNFIFNLF